MNRLILAVALAAGYSLAAISPALAATKNYDCSKPGNANKAVCKGAAKDASKAAAKPAPIAKTAPARATAAAKPAATKVSSTTSTKTVTEKNYDCSKPGNKNKAVCKSAAVSPAKPVVKQVTAATQTRHYDCAKAGNAGKQECKVSTSAKQTATKPVAQAKVTAVPAPKPRPAAAPRRTAATTPASVEDHNPSGAAAQCKDGTYSHSKTRTGACSRHGGVAKWM
jgi:hypothetical protein